MKKLLIAFLFPLMAFGQGTPTLRFNTVADMVARPIPTVNNSLTALVTGRVTANDGGGGTFYFVAASVTATNTGTVFPSTGISGRWFRQYSGDLNVKWFGAVGDGVTDDRVAFNNTVAVLTAAGGGIFIPRGIYVTTSASPLLGLTNVNLVAIRGEGRGNTTLKQLGTGDAVNLVGTSEIYNISISDLDLIGNDTAAKGIFCQNLKDGAITRLGISGFLNHGIDGTGANTLHTVVSYCRITAASGALAAGRALNVRQGTSWRCQYNYFNIGGTPASPRYDTVIDLRGHDQFVSIGNIFDGAVTGFRMNGAFTSIGEYWDVNTGTGITGFCYIPSANSPTVIIQPRGIEFSKVDTAAINLGYLHFIGSSNDTYIGGFSNIVFTAQTKAQFDAPLVANLAGTFQAPTAPQIRVVSVAGNAGIWINGRNNAPADETGLRFMDFAGTTQKGALMINNSELTMVSGNTDTLTVEAGEVGINTANPAAPLHVVSSSGADTVRLIGRNNGGTDESFVLFFRNNGTTQQGALNAHDTQLDLVGATAVALSLKSTGVTAENNFAIALGKTLTIVEGANARQGQATMINSTVTVANTSVTANTRIHLTRANKNASTTIGVLQVGTITAGVSFVIEASTLAAGVLSADDDSTVNWLLIEPSP